MDKKGIIKKIALAQIWFEGAVQATRDAGRLFEKVGKTEPVEETLGSVIFGAENGIQLIEKALKAFDEENEAE